MDRSGLSCLRYSSVPRLLLCINGALECSWALRTPYPHHCCVKRGSLILSGLQILLWGPDCVETGKPTHRRLTGPLFVFCTLSCACTHTHTHTHTSGWLPMALQSQVSAGVYCKQRRGLSGYFPRHIQAWWKKKKKEKCRLSCQRGELMHLQGHRIEMCIANVKKKRLSHFHVPGAA